MKESILISLFMTIVVISLVMIGLITCEFYHTEILNQTPTVSEQQNNCLLTNK